MIQITEFISIDEKEIKEEFIRSSGPGGQNVNKVATAVQLRFNAAGSSSLPGEVRERLIHLAGKRVTIDGMLIITARRFRTQEKNREDAFQRLTSLIREACKSPVKRKKTNPTGASIKLRLKKKRKKSEKKKHRQAGIIFDE
ncbi:MAG: aminoacyl-tRNA hydrolase [Spirochaetes bacterium]|nr:aminoacyl-tRNA hydrolase [Spirochaetota bacterium]